MVTSRRQFRLKFLFRQYLEAILLALVLAVVLRWVVLSPYRVSGESMEPVLKTGDLVFAYKLPFGISLPLLNKKVGPKTLPSLGSLVVVGDRALPETRGAVVRRVIGRPGDKVEVRKGIIWLNDRAVTEIQGERAFETLGGRRYSVSLLMEEVESFNLEPVLVPPNQVYVMPDLRRADTNAKQHPLVPLQAVEARPFLIWMSLDWSHRGESLPRFRTERFMRSVH